MAFTKITLTTDTIRAAFTRFNTFIDDLKSVASGKGSSQIGLRDAAGNVDADNLEDGVAEIYTDVTSARTMADVLDENSATTSGLNWGYKAGLVRFDNTIRTLTAGTVALTDDATNYVEIKSDGTVVKNTTGFTSGRVPIRQVVTSGGSQSTSTDKRSWFQAWDIPLPVAKGGTANSTALTNGQLWIGKTSDTPQIAGLTGTTDQVTVTNAAGSITLSAPTQAMLYKGFCIRAKFDWQDADEININPGVYEVNGKIVYWDSQLTSDIGSPSVSDWYYLYLDDSEISASGIITTAKLIWANTEPSWSASKHGWYNGNDRCIFAVLTDGSSNIVEFFHDGDLVSFCDRIIDLDLTDIDATWTDVTLTIPKFTTKALITGCVFANGDVNPADGTWRTDGQTAAIGHYLGRYCDEDKVQIIINQSSVISSTAQKIEVKMGAAGDHQIGIYTDGWYFPIGM